MRLVIVSNRLPVTIKKTNKGFVYEHSVGGLVTAVNDYLESLSKDSAQKAFRDNNLWVGWPGITVKETAQQIVRNELLNDFHSYPIFLPEKEMDKFYQGFCNKTLWPLFHYFPLLTVYDNDYWDSYKCVNEMFSDALAEVIQPEDVVWIHDYHLMLLPTMLRKRFPNLKIGFFLHIPFPSFEIFRLLPIRWREKILQGLLGADLLGFHTHEYTQYFLHCVQRLLGYEHNMGKLLIEHRVVKADTFPISINFKKFYEAADYEPEVVVEIEKLKEPIGDLKAILSIDRLDYTKGILNRLNGYKRFLKNNPEWRKKVIFVLVVAPSRTGIEHYREIKRQVDGLVGKINGRFGDMTWSPILYQYKGFEFPYLAALYRMSDVALVTPLRDGMNLIAKEYVASRKDKRGVLILSEMAGAAKELGEAVVINPNNTEEIAEAIKMALSMDETEQMHRNQMMQARLQSYDVVHWANDFLVELQKICDERAKIKSRMMSPSAIKELVATFKKAKRKILFLDYDGTLTPLVKFPYLAKPNSEIISLLKKLIQADDVSVVLISGRPKTTLREWFPFSGINLAAEHGFWIKRAGKRWYMPKLLTNDWKQPLLAILETYANRVPGTFVENKEYSICWHYRNAEPETGGIKAKELIDDLVSFTANADIQIMQGHKIVEIRNAGVNKGTAALQFLSKEGYDFILAVGDDLTDEDLFQALPPKAYSIKVGIGQSHAKYHLYNSDGVLALLKKLTD